MQVINETEFKERGLDIINNSYSHEPIYVTLNSQQKFVIISLDDYEELTRQKPENKASKSINSVRKLKGLGKEIWQGVDPDKYIEELRKEW